MTTTNRSRSGKADRADRTTLGIQAMTLAGKLRFGRLDAPRRFRRKSRSEPDVLAVCDDQLEPTGDGVSCWARE